MTTYAQAKPAGTPTWLDLSTSDMDGARAFYRALFGWDYDISGPEFGGYTIARVGQRMAAGIAPNVGSDGAVFPVAWGPYFASHDIDADGARAVSAGAATLFPPMTVGDFGRMAGYIDPGGAVFSYWQAGSHIGAEVTDEPGALTWCELYATDAKQARDFYAALLNATVDPMPGDLEYYVLMHGDTPLCGIMQIDPAWGNLPPHWAVYFAVADTDAAAALIASNGGQVLGPVEDTPFGRMAAAVDPFGAHFKIIKLPSQ